MLSSCSGQKVLVRAVAFSPDGKTLASAGIDRPNSRSFALWETATGKEVRLIKDPTIQPESVAFAADGKTIAAGQFGDLHFWDLPNAKQLGSLDHVYNVYNDNFNHLAFSPDGKTLASAAGNGQIRLWDVARRKERINFPGHRSHITALAVSPNGKTVVTGSQDGTARLWELATGKQVRQFRDEGELSGGAMVLSVALSPDGKTLALAHLGGGEAGVTLWDVAGGRMLGRLTRYKYCIASLAFSPDGKSLVTEGLLAGYLHLWDLTTRKEVRKFNKNKEQGHRVAFSPDGRTIASAAHELYLWETATGQLLHHLEGGGQAVAFSPDSFLLAAVSFSQVKLLETTTAKEVGPHGGYHHHSDLPSAAFSPEGRFLAVDSEQGVQVLEVVTGRVVRTFRSHPGKVTCLAYSPDGKTLVSGADDFTALTWDVTGLIDEKEKEASKPEQMKDLWDDLINHDRLKAYDALRRLRGSPEQTLAFLQKQLPPVVAIEPKRIAQLLIDLNSDEFQMREKAALKLRELGDLAEKALRQALKDKPELDTRKRVEGLLERLANGRQRTQYALQMLERWGTPEVQRFLERLAKGEPDAWQTREAKAALQRLAKRAAMP